VCALSVFLTTYIFVVRKLLICGVIIIGSIFALYFSNATIRGSKGGSVRLKSFLNRNGVLSTNEALIVAYLNVKSGLYPPPNGQDAETYVQGLYDDVSYGAYGANSEQRLIAAVEATY
tara:strand:+ start:559 stop:912 length:354 start_codon:yes stop_codon:yes gene_type:complete